MAKYSIDSPINNSYISTENIAISGVSGEDINIKVIINDSTEYEFTNNSDGSFNKSIPVNYGINNIDIYINGEFDKRYVVTRYDSLPVATVVSCEQCSLGEMKVIISCSDLYGVASAKLFVNEEEYSFEHYEENIWSCISPLYSGDINITMINLAGLSGNSYAVLDPHMYNIENLITDWADICNGDNIRVIYPDTKSIELDIDAIEHLYIAVYEDIAQEAKFEISNVIGEIDGRELAVSCTDLGIKHKFLLDFVPEKGTATIRFNYGYLNIILTALMK